MSCTMHLTKCLNWASITVKTPAAILFYINPPTCVVSRTVAYPDLTTHVNLQWHMSTHQVRPVSFFPNTSSSEKQQFYHIHCLDR